MSVGVAHLSQLGFVFHPTNDLGVVGKIYYTYLQLWSPHSLFKIPLFPTTRREYDCEGGPDAKICETTTSTCGCRATKGKKERHDVKAQDH